MSPVFIIFIILIAAGLIYQSIELFTNTTQKKNENLCLLLSHEGTTNNLIFCSQEILYNKVIGIDGINRKIMIVQKNKAKYDRSVISLDEVQNCELITSSGPGKENDLKRFGIVTNLDTIELRFEFKNHAQPASIIFYDSLTNSKKELEFLKAKAEYWSVMFSRMLTRQVRMRA